MIKEFFNTDSFMFKLAKLLSKLGLSPNTWTVISLIPAILGVWCAYINQPLAAFVAFLISGGIDGLDGAIARLTKKLTRIGGFLDGVVDRFVDFMMVFSFIFILPDFLIPVSWWVAIAAYWALMPTFIVAYADHRKAVDDPKEKVVWRILHRVEMYGLWMITFIVAAFNPMWAMYLFAFTTVLSVITAFQAFFLAIYKSKQMKNQML